MSQFIEGEDYFSQKTDIRVIDENEFMRVAFERNNLPIKTPESKNNTKAAQW